MYYIIDKDAKTYNVWNYKEQCFCTDFDAAYDSADGFGYVSLRYARKIMNKLLRSTNAAANLAILDREELFDYLNVDDWRNSH